MKHNIIIYLLYGPIPLEGPWMPPNKGFVINLNLISFITQQRSSDKYVYPLKTICQ